MSGECEKCGEHPIDGCKCHSQSKIDITCIGCLHGFEPELPGGDLLIITGDLTARGTQQEFNRFFDWLSLQDHYRKKIFICGNHDELLSHEPPQKIANLTNPNFELFEYLCDSGTEFAGLNIWGSPWSLSFMGINPECATFTCTEKEIEEKWKLIPQHTDILITHSPPHGILDGIPNFSTGKIDHVGSKSLHKYLNWDGALKLHVFSHIHEGYGEERSNCGIFSTHSVNCSVMNERYKPVNRPIHVEV